MPNKNGDLARNAARLRGPALRVVPRIATDRPRVLVADRGVASPRVRSYPRHIVPRHSGGGVRVIARARDRRHSRRSTVAFVWRVRPVQSAAARAAKRTEAGDTGACGQERGLVAAPPKPGTKTALLLHFNRARVVIGAARRRIPRRTRGGVALLTLALILLVLWLLGVVGTYTVGAFVHVLLVIALVLILVNFIGGRRTVV